VSDLRTSGAIFVKSLSEFLALLNLPKDKTSNVSDQPTAVGHVKESAEKRVTAKET
jgi:hypothetical protein